MEASERSRRVRPRLAFAALVAVGTLCWVGALLSWVAFTHFMVVGDHPLAGPPIGCRPCLEEGIPDARGWVGIAWALGLALAVGSWLADVSRARRVSLGLACASLLAAGAASLGMIAGAQSARDYWARFRFVQGDPAAPVVALLIEHQHTACAVAAVTTQVALGLFLGLAHRRLAPAPLIAAGLAQLAACALAWAVLELDATGLATELPELAASVTLASLSALAFTALAGALWAFRGVDAGPCRAHWAGLVGWVILGAVLRVSTLSYDADMRSPPLLYPLERGSAPWPWVERCEDFGLATVIEVREREVVINAQVARGVEDLERAIEEDDAREGASAGRALRVAAAELDDDVAPMQPYLRTAREHGLRDAELVVQERLRYPSATYGTIRDRRTCAVRVPIERLLGARTYGEMLTRAGARASSRPRP